MTCPDPVSSSHGLKLSQCQCASCSKADVFLSHLCKQHHHQLQHQLQGRREPLPGTGLFLCILGFDLFVEGSESRFVVSRHSCPFSEQWERVLSLPVRPGVTAGAAGTRRKLPIS